MQVQLESELKTQNEQGRSQTFDREGQGGGNRK